MRNPSAQPCEGYESSKVLGYYEVPAGSGTRPSQHDLIGRSQNMRPHAKRKLTRVATDYAHSRVTLTLAPGKSESEICMVCDNSRKRVRASRPLESTASR